MEYYRLLPPVEDILDLFEEENLADVPENWMVVITDIKGSTKAIEEGRYKDVNTAGGLAVMALANALEGMEFPFIFGGDGVTFLIPESVMEQAHDILVDTVEKVRLLYDLELRVGAVSVRELRSKNLPIRVGKLRISQYYEQAILTGEGVDLAERWIKEEGSRYLLGPKRDPLKEADFTGFTCRWQDIPSHSEEVIALIIKFAGQSNEQEKIRVSRDVFRKIESILGGEHEYHPLREANLHVATDKKILQNEAKALAKHKSGIRFLLALWKIKFETTLTKMIMFFKIPLKAYWYKLPELKTYQIISSDYRKYDGTFKMIAAVSTESRRRLEEYLQKEYEAGRLFYGLHVTNRALMTCLMHRETTREVHFIDAADGGYALAAKMLKSQLK